jgi:hypothetical protein
MAEPTKVDDLGDIESIIEIRDEQINTAEIMRTIRVNLKKRRETAQAQGVNFDDFVRGLYTDDKGHFDAAVYYNLRRAATLYDQITVKQYVSPRAMPVVGGLVQRVRSALHDLVIYYVNMLGSKQAMFNESILYALNALVEGLERDVERQSQEIASLQQELELLRAQVAELRQP